MINKFRYKKPANKDNSASDCKDNNVSKCGEFGEDTLRRRKEKKDNSVRGETKTDTLKKDKSGGVLDEQTKKQLHVSLPLCCTISSF